MIVVRAAIRVVVRVVAGAAAAARAAARAAVGATLLGAVVGADAGTDARAIQVAQSGIATGLLSIPLRYMHTPSEMVDLKDIEHTVQLLVAFAQSLKAGENGVW